VSGKIATQQSLCLRPTILAQLCSIIAKSEKQFMFRLVTDRQRSIETSHNLRFTCEMFLHQFPHARDQEWKLQRTTVNRAVPAIRNFHVIGIDDFVAKTFWQKFSVKRPDNFASHLETNPVQNLGRVDSNDRFGVLDGSQGLVSKKDPDRNHQRFGQGRLSLVLEGEGHADLQD
jgi:hypothetical protein